MNCLLASQADVVRLFVAFSACIFWTIRTTNSIFCHVFCRFFWNNLTLFILLSVVRLRWSSRDGGTALATDHGVITPNLFLHSRVFNILAQSSSEQFPPFICLHRFFAEATWGIKELNLWWVSYLGSKHLFLSWSSEARNMESVVTFSW